MLNFGNKEFRNLQEQVLKNMKDIQDIEQGATVLADFGIKIVGQVNDATELPDPTTYDGEYGDGYVVGESEPYEYYIFTRAFEGQEEPSWFNLGQFPVPGPQGEAGATGAQGPSGTIAFGNITTSTLNPGQSASVSATNVGSASNAVYNLAFAIPQGAQGIQGPVGPQGPQGNQGPKGDKGDKGEQGGLIEIVGIVATANDLPAPSTLQKLDAAYLVGSSPDYELYVQVGETPSTALWTNLGAINEGTVVTVNGTPQTVWEANSKLSISDGYLVDTLYGQAAGSGNGQTHIPYGTAATASYIAQRDLNGQLLVPETPTANNMAASKAYVDANAGGQSPIQYAGDLIVGDSQGEESRLAIGASGQVLKVNSSANGVEWSTINEVPSYTTSDADKVLKTNTSGTGLEWGSAGGGAFTSVESIVSTYKKSAVLNPVSVSSSNFKGQATAAVILNPVTSGNYYAQFQPVNNTNIKRSIISYGYRGNSSSQRENVNDSIILGMVGIIDTVKYTTIDSSIISGNSYGVASVCGGISGCIVFGEGNELTSANDYSSQAKGCVVLGTGNILDVRSTTNNNNYGKIIVGSYNDRTIDPSEKFIVGTGTSDSARRNCFSTGYDSTTTPAQSYIKIGSTKITEAQLQALLATL